MTQEDKQLLLKDLCARLPYRVKINIYDDYSGIMKDEGLNVFHLNSTYNIEYRKLRPYLRPMASMTDEEKEDFGVPFTSEGLVTLADTVECMDWLNKHQFDYRGLIEKGLALEAPEGMYKQ